MSQLLTGPLATLGGGRTDVLEAVKGARSKFVAMGAVVLATAGIAAISAGFAAHIAFDAGPLVAVLIGTGWGTVILAIDRALMVGMANQPSLGRNLALAVPRVVLAVILGTVISTPITLQIFHKETDAEIQTLHREAADQFAKDLAADTRFATIPDLQQQVADAKARVTSGGGADSAVKDKQAAYDAALAKYQELQADAQCELNGTCGTMHAGDAEAYQSAKQAADNQLGRVNAAKQDLDTASATSVAQAGKDLQKAQDQLSQLQSDKQARQNEFNTRNADNTGLLIRLEALERLGAQHSIMGWAHALLWAMFTCVELLPVLIKLLMNIGAMSEYDRVQKNLDAGDADVLDDQLQTWKNVRRTQNQIELDKAQHDRNLSLAELRKDFDVAQDQLDRAKAQDTAINARSAQVQTKVIDAYLDVYEQQVLDQAQHQLDHFKREFATNAAAFAPVIHPKASDPPQDDTLQTVAEPRNGSATNLYIKAAQLPDGTVL